MFFSASFSSHSRGVITLIHNSLPFHLINVDEDRFGRNLIIQCEILSVRLNLVNLYGPNGDNPSFLQNLFLSLADLSGNFIIGGDFNCTLQPDIDRSTGLDSSHTQTRKELLQSIKELNLVDRKYHPDKLTFSCYSATCQTFSRTDYFLISAPLVSMISKSGYDSIIISDHAPVSVSLNMPQSLNYSPRWRLQSFFGVLYKFIQYRLFSLSSRKTKGIFGSIRQQAP